MFPEAENAEIAGENGIAIKKTINVVVKTLTGFTFWNVIYVCILCILLLAKILNLVITNVIDTSNMTFSFIFLYDITYTIILCIAIVILLILVRRQKTGSSKLKDHNVITKREKIRFWIFAVIILTPLIAVTLDAISIILHMLSLYMPTFITFPTLSCTTNCGWVIGFFVLFSALSILASIFMAIFNAIVFVNTYKLIPLFNAKKSNKEKEYKKVEDIIPKAAKATDSLLGEV